MARGRISHNYWYIDLVIFNIIALVAVFVFIVFSVSGTTYGIFLTTQTAQYDRFQLDITPPAWLLYIWYLLLPWQCFWLLFIFVTLFRKNDFKEPLYVNPYLLSPLVLGVYVIGNGSTFAWSILFDRSYKEGSLAAIGVSFFLIVMALVLSYSNSDENWESLVRQRRRNDVWLVRGLVHNGLAFYVSWVFVAMLVNLAIVMAYMKGSDVTAEMASTIALGVWAVVMVVYSLVDMIFWDRYCRYTVTPYLVSAVALVAILVENWEQRARNPVISAVLAGLSCLALVMKMVLTITRHVKNN